MIDRPKRYRAFISYSQQDKSVAKRLHQALQRWRAPKGIDATPLGPDRKLGRFFRDEEEMGSAESLGAALEGAIDDSEHLIVVATPNSAQSRWVGAEIRRFKRRPGAKVFAVIARGSPGSGDQGTECFHPALREKIGPDGNPTGEADEPLAPNLKSESFSKIVARLASGFLGVSFDTLWEHEKRRNAARRWRAIGGAASVLVAVIAIAAFGIRTRLDAAAQSSRVFADLARSYADREDFEAAARHAIAGVTAGLGLPAFGFEPSMAEAQLRRAAAQMRIRKVLRGHAAFITALAFSDDARLVASGSGDRSVRVWSMTTGEQVGILRLSGEVSSIAFISKLQLWAIAAHDSGGVRIWDATKRAIVETLATSTNGIQVVSTSPDESLLAAWSGQGTIEVFELPERGDLQYNPQFTIETTCSGTLTAGAISSTHLAAGCRDGGVLVYDLQTRELAFTYRRQTGRITSIAFTADGSDLISASTDGSVHFFHARDPQPYAVVSFDASVSSIAISKDGAILAAACADGWTRVWEVGSGTLIASVVGNGGETTAAALSRDGGILATGTWNFDVNVWDMTVGRPNRALAVHDSPVMALSAAADGSSILSAGFDGSVVRTRFEPGARMSGARVGGGGAKRVAFDPLGRFAVFGAESGEALLVDLSSGHAVSWRAHDDPITSVAVAPDASLIATASSEGIVRIWRRNDHSLVASFSGPGVAINTIAFSPDARMVAAGADDRVVRIWDLLTKSEIARIITQGAELRSVAFSADGESLASASFDGKANVWDVRTSREIAAFSVGAAPILSTAFSRDGRFVLTGSADRTVRLWDVRSSAELLRLNAGSQVTTVAFGPGGDTVVAGDVLGEVRIWTLPEAVVLTRSALVDRACARLASAGVATLPPSELERIPATDAARRIRICGERQ
ncbi:MAG: TIR domain-containing protein [Terricaulis sp.]